jgi:hypothetical protein
MRRHAVLDEHLGPAWARSGVDLGSACVRARRGVVSAVRGIRGGKARDLGWLG